MTLHDFTQSMIVEMRKRIKSESSRVESRADADAVHDLRVAIRRLTQVLRIVGPVVDKQKSKEERHSLRPVMDLAGQIRNYDIAIELCHSAKIPARSALLRRLHKDRKSARDVLVSTVTNKPIQGKK